MEEIYSLVSKRRRIRVSFDSNIGKGHFYTYPLNNPDGKQTKEKGK
jgi:hypothetical protein